MFLNLLTLIAGATVLVAALKEGAKSGPFGAALGLVLGATFGFCCFYGTRRILKWTIKRLNLQDPNPGPTRVLLSWLICACVFLWMLVCCGVTTWITRLVIGMIR